jgi:hypothetical protein
MLGLIIYTSAAFGLAFIAGHSQISVGIRRFIAPTNRKISWPREWIIELIECPACLGTWIGAIYGLAFQPLWCPWWMLALFTAGSNFTLGRLTGLIKI